MHCNRFRFSPKGNLGQPTAVLHPAAISIGPNGPSSGLDFGNLDQSDQRYCHRVLADATRRSYRTVVNRFLNFCTMYSLTDPLPVLEATLCYYAAFLGNQGLAPRTISSYLSALRTFQVLLGFPDSRGHTSLPRLCLVIAGIDRVRSEHSASNQSVSRQRLPITPTILFHLWATAGWSYERRLLWAAASVCFFSFFRSGEVTPAQSTFDPQIHLAWGDITVNSTIEPATLRLFLRCSKTDQLGHGVNIFMGKLGNEICPVQATLSYVALRGSRPGPFFCHSDGVILTKLQFVTGIRSALQAIGLLAEQLAGPSFRIGVATTAAQARIEDSVIQTLGRWSSYAFLAYIRTPRDQLAHYASILAHSI